MENEPPAIISVPYISRIDTVEFAFGFHDVASAVVALIADKLFLFCPPIFVKLPPTKTSVPFLVIEFTAPSGLGFQFCMAPVDASIAANLFCV